VSELVRFGVAMDRELLSEFDRRIAARGYENRSEALRDLVRADLTRDDWERGAHVAATLTLVCDRRSGDLPGRLAELEEAHPGLVAGTLRLPLDSNRSLEVMALRGPAGDLEGLAGRIAGQKGVLSCELTLAAGL
jgi:CopG family nickel-responsive transcriptional regulator